MLSKFFQRIILLIFLFVQFTAFSQDAPENVKQIVWEQVFYSYFNGEKILLFSERFPRSKPCTADIDDDGDQDLFLGLANGKLAYFENAGSVSNPVFELKSNAVEMVNLDEDIIPIQFGTNLTCFFLDYGNDRDFDLLIANEEGKFRLLENIGDRKSAVYSAFRNNFIRHNLGKGLAMSKADLNADGLEDIIVGNNSGNIYVFYNKGDYIFAEYDSDPVLIHTFPELRYNVVPSFIDWDMDGDQDLVAGTEEGRIIYLENTGTKEIPSFRPIFNFHFIKDVDGFSAPHFVDMNNDGHKDLIVGNITENVRYYENRPDELLPQPSPNEFGEIPPKPRTVWSIKRNAFNFKSPVNYGRNAAIAVGDADNDGDNDIIVGEADGTLNLFLNLNNNKQPNYIQFSDNLFPNVPIKNPVPEFIDLDNDGYQDLLVGSESGTMVHFINNARKGDPSWRFDNLQYGNISVGSKAAPRALDFDRDGKMDLFIGSGSGRVFYFKNNGSKEEPLFVEKILPFANPKRDMAIVPAFIDYRGNGYESMITGTEDGSLEILKDRLPEGFEEVFNNTGKRFDYSRLSSYLPQFIANLPRQYSLRGVSPYTVDMDGDGRIDLLLANGTGAVLYFRNAEYEEFKAAPKKEFKKYANIDPIFNRATPLIQLNTERVYPTTGDLNADGNIDLVYGTADGNVYFVKNSGNSRKPAFSRNNIKPLFRLNAENISPFLYDLDGDSDLDLFLGKKDGEFLFYENIGTNKAYDFVPAVGVFDGLRVNRNSTPSAVRISADREFVISGDILGKINQLAYGQRSSGYKYFEILDRNFGGIDIGIASAPVLSDLNIDGIPEMIIGSDSGAIQIFKSRTGRLEEQNWNRQKSYEPKPRFNPGTFPAVADMDGDQDADLIIGTMEGTLYFVENEAIK